MGARMDILIRSAVYRGSELPAACSRELEKYRLDIFIKQLGWSLPSKYEDAEWDQYDTDETTHIILQDQCGVVYGCARLVPTHGGNYMLGQLFSHLVPKQIPLPDSDSVRELSRLAVSAPRSALAGHAQGTLQSSLLGMLLAVAVSRVLHNGVRQLVDVTFLGVERLLRHLGLHIHRAGPAIEIDGRMIVAGWIELDAQTINALGVTSRNDEPRQASYFAATTTTTTTRSCSADVGRLGRMQIVPPPPTTSLGIAALSNGVGITHLSTCQATP